METPIETIFPASIPYEDDLYKWNYDDCGILCRFNKEEESWEVMEPQCVDCGHKPEACDCEDELTYQQGWIDALLTQLTAKPQTRATTKKIAELRQLRDQAQEIWGYSEEETKEEVSREKKKRLGLSVVSNKHY